MKKSRVPVVMIGLDAAEAGLIEKLCEDGRLPNLQKLRERGAVGVMESNALHFAGGVWPTFYTSKDVPWHGIYHNKLWRHENMRCEIATEEWLQEKPFWEDLSRQGYRVAIIDVPMTLGKPKPLNGIHLSGWGTHDLIQSGSWPVDLWPRLKKQFGSSRTPPELFGPQSGKTLLQLRNSLLKSTEQMVRIGEYLLSGNRWDFFLFVLGATHRGGHYLWNLSQINKQQLKPGEKEILQNALVDIYQVCDKGIGRLLEKAPPDARIIVFAVHGMGINPGWTDHSGEILNLIKNRGEQAPAKTGLLFKVKQMVPWQITRQITTRLPKNVQDWLVTQWSAKMADWGQTQFFALPMDHACYIRFNVQGREPGGLVQPGETYEELCNFLSKAFRSFCDIDTGKSIVKGVYRQDEMAPATAPYRDRLPDLVITWNDISAINSRGITSPKFGTIRWEEAHRLYSGRSGNHTGHGWFLATGAGIQPATRPQGYHILDLAPTIYRWLGAEIPGDFQGKYISEICR